MNDIKKECFATMRASEKVQSKVVFTMVSGIVKANTNIFAGEDAGNTDPNKILTDMNFYNGVLEPGEYGETENAKIFGLGTQSYTGTSNVYIGGSMLIDSVIKDGKTVKELKGGVYGGAYCPPGSTITHKGTTNVTYSTIVSNTNGEIFGGHLGNVITSSNEIRHWDY